MKILKQKTSSGHTKLIQAQNLQVGEYFMKASAWYQTQDTKDRLKGMRAREVKEIEGVISVCCSMAGRKWHTYYAKSENLVVVLPIGGKVLNRKELKTGKLLNRKELKIGKLLNRKIY